MYRSPNGQIRGILNGTVFREPILCSNVPRIIPGWKAPIIVGRHAYADQYACQDMLTPTSGGKLTMRFEPADGGDAVERTVFEFGQGQSGIALTMYNTDDSIRGFARSSFLYARSRGMPLYLATKNTILKVYDGRFADIFAEVGKEFPDVQYEMRLIDDMVAQMVKNDGGYVLALKNYDGDGTLSVAGASESLTLLFRLDARIWALGPRAGDCFSAEQSSSRGAWETYSMPCSSHCRCFVFLSWLAGSPRSAIGHCGSGVRLSGSHDVGPAASRRQDILL